MNSGINQSPAEVSGASRGVSRKKIRKQPTGDGGLEVRQDIAEKYGVLFGSKIANSHTLSVEGLIAEFTR